MTTNPSRPSLGPWANSLVVTLTVLVFLTGYARSFNYAFRGNDDTVWLYLTGVELFHPSAAAPLHEAVRDFLPMQPDGERALQRWNLRANYAANYLLPSALIYGASRAIKPIIDGFEGNFALFVTLSLALGVILSAVVAVSVLRWAILSCDSSAASFGTLLGLAAVAALSVLPEDTPKNLIDTGGPLQSVLYLLKLFFVTGPEPSIFGYTPRSQFLVCALAVFLLRWHRRWRGAYVLTILLSLLHQSMAGLLLGLLVVLDLVARPQIFDRKTVAIVALGAVVMFGRERLFSTLGLWPAITALVIVILAIGAVMAAHRYGKRLPWWEALDSRLLGPVRQRADRLGPIGADLATAWTLWLLTLPAALVATRMVDPASAYHFWGEIHLRVLMLLQPVTFVGLAILAIGWLEANLVIDRRWLYATIVVAAVLATAPAAVQAVAHYDAGLLRAGRMLNQYNALLGKPLPALDIQTREAVLCYAIALELDGQSNLVRPMLESQWQWPAPPRQ
jgi:hypothetical protein